MYNEGLDQDLVSKKFRIQDLVVNYFQKSYILDKLEYKFITDLDTLEELSYELNTQKEILKQLNKYHKETCKKCQFKILQTIKNIRSITPDYPSHVRRKVAVKKNIKYTMNEKSVSPKFRELKMNQNENIDNISAILNDDRTSFYSNSNNNIIQKQKPRNLVNKNKKINKNGMTNNINKINKNSTYEKKKNKIGNRKLTPDINNNNKNYNKINRTGNNYNRISNVSADKYNKNIKKAIQKKGASKAINKDKNIRKENIRNNLNYRNINAANENKIGYNKINNKIKGNNKNINTNTNHKISKTEYNLEDYQVIGDYIPRFPNEKDLEDNDYFYYDNDNDKENNNKINIKDNNNENNKDLNISKKPNLEIKLNKNSNIKKMMIIWMNKILKIKMKII